MFVKETRDNYWMLNWLDQFMMGHKGFICGGCFKNIFNKEEVKDLDIFFQNRLDFENAIAYYDRQTVGYSEDGVDKLNEDDAEYKFLYENENVKAYVHKNTGVRIELCCKIFGTAEDILSQFDFTITKFAYYKEEVEDEIVEEVKDIFGIDVPKTHIEYKVLMHDKFFEHLHMKRLVTDDKILFPMSTLERSFRYAKYGYFPCKETKMKIARAIKELDDEQLEVSESLYNGMD
ncbi:MAG: hypothetical protein IJ444_02295 [Kiritimatiellae bacterium]|nr:hypothetical protein [Kiritimatiellia bacterium]